MLCMPKDKYYSIFITLTVNMYTVGIQNYICPTAVCDLIVARQHCEEPDPPVPLCFLEMAQEIMTQHNIVFLPISK